MNDRNPEQAGLIQQISYPLYSCRGWMKLLGVIYIIGGALQAITIVGILFAWMPIWLGLILYKSASAAENAYQQGNEYELVQSLAKIKTYFMIMGIATLLGIIITIVMFIFLILTGSFLSTLIMQKM